MNNRFLNGIAIIEAPNGRLNTSSPQVETQNTDGWNNVTYTKKIGNKGYSSSAQVKNGMKEFAGEIGEKISLYIKKNDNEKDNSVLTECDPYHNFNEDVFGHMRAEKQELSEEQFNELSEETKKLYSKNGKKYTCNTTKKRVARFKMNGFIGLGLSKVKKEWNVCKTTTQSALYRPETYCDIMSSIFNFDIKNVGKFNISDDATQFRDYTVKEAEVLGIQQELPLEDRKHRIEITLRALQHLSIKSNQSNNLTDTAPKVVILGEYSWGNNVFYGVIKKNGIDIEVLKETIEDNEQFRLSKIWIGVSSKIMSEQFKVDKEDLKQQIEEADLSDIVEVMTVGQAFNSYIDYMKNTLE